MEVKKVVTAIRHKVRRKISRLTAKKTLHSRELQAIAQSNAGTQPTIFFQPKPDGDEQSGPFGHDGPQSHSLDPHSQPEHKTKTAQDVDDVNGNRNVHRETGVLHADKPAFECIHRQNGRSPPYAHPEVSGRILPDLLAGIQQIKGQTPDRILQRQDGYRR